MSYHDPLGRRPGEPLDPLKHTAEDMAIRQKGNPRLWASVWQQTPRVIGGNIINPAWFKIISSAEVPIKNVKWVRAWDLAFSEKQVGSSNPDFTAGAKLGLYDSQHSDDYYIIISDIIRWREVWPISKRRIASVAESDGLGCRIIIESGGPQKGLGSDLKYDPMFAKYIVKTGSPVPDKVARAQVWADKAEAGKILIVRGGWNESFISEAEIFNRGAHDDQIDAISLGYWYLARFLGRSSVSTMRVKGLYK